MTFLVPLILVGAICNAIYCVAKIYQDFTSDRQAFGIVGLVGLLAGTALSMMAFVAVIVTRI